MRSLSTVIITLLWMHPVLNNAYYDRRKHVGQNPNSLRRQQPVYSKDPDSGNANFTTDLAIKVIKKKMLRLGEPVELDVVGPCSKCFFSGLSKMRRDGSATSIDLEEDRKRVKVCIAFPYINVTCQCSIGYILYVTGEVQVSMVHPAIYMDVIVDTDKEETDILKIRVIQTGEVDADFDGYGILGNIVDKFTFLFRSFFVSSVRHYIFKEIPRVIEDEHKDRLFQLGYLKK